MFVHAIFLDCHAAFLFEIKAKIVPLFTNPISEAYVNEWQHLEQLHYDSSVGM